MLRSRLAPTPSGFLHAGNCYNFVLTAKLVAEANGVLRLRIDDLDQERVRLAYVQHIFTTLRALQIAWQEGPKNDADFEAHFSQRYRLLRYKELIKNLASGGNVFACQCSRSALALRGATARYDGHCLNLNIDLESPNVCWRLKTNVNDLVLMKGFKEPNQELSVWEENRFAIVRRRDGLPAYHIASLADDVDFDMNLIVRGQDLLASTVVQLHLAKLLGMQSFIDCRFVHHPLLLDAAGNKLSKSAGNGLTALPEL